MWKKLKLYLNYGGVTPEIYDMIEPNIIQSNWANLHRFTSLVAMAMLIMLAASALAPSLEKNRSTYTVFALVNIVLMLLSLGPCRKYNRLVQPCVYVFMSTLLLFGIILCTVVEPNEVAVSFVIMLFGLPLLFTDRPIHVIAQTAVATVLYVVIAKYTINHMPDNARAILVRGYNYTNIVPYGILGMVVSSYMMQIKIERFSYILRTRMLSETDQMTGLLNRRSYSIQLENLRTAEPSDSLIVCSVDVNGLKTVNDNMGHNAGDELICGAARCIEKAFGIYGQVYRTGGDEFTAILHKREDITKETLKEALVAQCAAWRGSNVRTLAVSVGIIQNTELLPIDDLIAKADADMYTDKARFYAETGQKRR